MENFGDRLISWYERNKRDLPWRNSGDPYKIWLSEIILQQTRVDQGLNYYLRFVEKYPDVFKMASASDDEIFKLWQGLGYYNRAANMINTARKIVADYNGVFPDNRDDLRKLKGVGSYTSAAIASMAFEEPVAVIDGNVYRVVSRIFGIKTPVNTSLANVEFDSIVTNLLAKHPPGIFNQALMEFGALYCKPRNPDCEECIFQSHCYAFEKNKVHEFPVKKTKTTVVKRYFYYFVVEVKEKNSDYFLLKKRESKDIWRNLYDFPMMEFSGKRDPLETFDQSLLFKSGLMHTFSVKSISPEYNHILSHQKIIAQFIRLVVDKKFKNMADKSLLLINRNEIINYPVPRLIDKYLKEQKII